MAPPQLCRLLCLVMSTCRITLPSEVCHSPFPFPRSHLNSRTPAVRAGEGGVRSLPVPSPFPSRIPARGEPLREKRRVWADWYYLWSSFGTLHHGRQVYASSFLGPAGLYLWELQSLLTKVRVSLADVYRPTATLRDPLCQSTSLQGSFSYFPCY